jgi:hypothetical protein
MEEDLKYGLDQIKKHLILTQDHLTSGSCPVCLREKHLPALQAYAEESLPMTSDEKIRNFLIKLREFALNMRRKLGDII